VHNLFSSLACYVLVSCAILLTGCTHSDGPTQPEDCDFESYRPLRIGSYWVYQIRDLERNKIQTDSLVVSSHEDSNGTNLYKLTRYIDGKKHSYTFVNASSDTILETIPTIIDDLRENTEHCECAGRTMSPMILCGLTKLTRNIKRQGDSLPSLDGNGNTVVSFLVYDMGITSTRTTTTLGSSMHVSFDNAPVPSTPVISISADIRDSIKVFTSFKGIVEPGRFDVGRTFIASEVLLKREYLTNVGIVYERVDRRVYSFPDPTAYERSFYERRLLRFRL
jgi:hypothetical protein